MSKLQRYCRSCGTQIPQARLEAAPGTKFCIGCADGAVGRKKALTFLDGDIEHGSTVVQFVDEEVAASYQAPELRDIADTEPEEFAKEANRPIKIKKRSELG